MQPLTFVVDMNHYEKVENLARTTEPAAYWGIATEAELGRIESGEGGVAGGPADDSGGEPGVCTDWG